MADNSLADSVIAFAAQYLLFLMAAGFAVFWLFGVDRAGKLRLGSAAVIGLALAVVFLLAAGKLHSDPRPFVQDPRLHPLFPHARDNGFPSDHSIAAGLIAGLVLFWSRRWGAVFALAACCVAVARVAAHVHHVQDVVAGLAARSCDLRTCLVSAIHPAAVGPPYAAGSNVRGARWRR